MKRLGDWFTGLLIAAMSRPQSPRPPGYYVEQDRAQEADEQRRADAKVRADIQRKLREQKGEAS